MGYYDRDRYRASDSPTISWPGIVLIIVLAIIAFYLMDDSIGIYRGDADAIYPASHAEEYLPSPGPDAYATK